MTRRLQDRDTPDELRLHDDRFAWEERRVCAQVEVRDQDSGNALRYSWGKAHPGLAGRSDHLPIPTLRPRLHGLELFSSPAVATRARLPPTCCYIARPS